MKHLCWTRIGEAGGEEPDGIIKRKECERSALGGTFFWQVGNAPPKDIRARWTEKTPIQIIFSELKGKSKDKDINPEWVMVWRNYFDCCRRLTKPLPDGILVTSGGLSCNSYALACNSRRRLTEMWKQKKEPFRPELLNKGIASQCITALFEQDNRYRKRVKPKWMNGYQVEMKASLVRKYGYWVCLQNPKVFKYREWKKRIGSMPEEDQRREWLKFVREIRSD